MFSRIIEEVFPFLYFYYIANKKTVSVYDITFSNFEFYSGLSDEKIVERLESEHNRAKEIDDKTFKFTLALSISLSIISAGADADSHIKMIQLIASLIESDIVTFLQQENDVNSVLHFIQKQME